jgi:hypothetical protein
VQEKAGPHYAATNGDDVRSIFSKEEIENFIDKLNPLASDPDRWNDYAAR